MAIPNEIICELDLQNAGELKGRHKADKDTFGVLGRDLKFAYQWRNKDRNLVGYDATTGVKFGEYTFGDNMKEEADIEVVTEFENDTNLVCCAVTYRDRSLLCCVDLSLSKVMHSIKINRRPITCLAVIKQGTSIFEEKQRVHPHLRTSKGLVAAGQCGGKILLIDMGTKHSNWWKHNEVNPTNMRQILKSDVDDPNLLQQIAEMVTSRGEHTAIVLDGMYKDPLLEITSMEFCEEPMILIIGYNSGIFDIWSLATLTKIHTSEVVGGTISHIMSMLPEEDPRKLIYVWVVSNGSVDSSNDEDVDMATANLFVISYKAEEGTGTGYEEIDTVNCVFRLYFDSPDKTSDSATHCLSVSPISIDVGNKYMSALNCTGLCSFVWSLEPLALPNSRVRSQYYVTVFDLGRWYGEEMPRHALISDLALRSSSYLANSHIEINNTPHSNHSLDAKVCAEGTKKYIWALNEEVTSHVAATSFSIMVLTNSRILQFEFPGIQSYMFDKIDNLPLFQLMHPRKLFYECLNAGLMPEGAYDKGKCYSKITVLEAIYEVAINHNLARFLRRCASEFFDGKYESASLSTQHLFEWAWSKALDVKAKSDELLTLLYSGQELTQSNKNSHNQFVDDLSSITQLFQHVEKEKLLHSEIALQGLRCRIKGLILVNDYLQCVQYFSSSNLLPDTVDGGIRRLSILKEDYIAKRSGGDILMVDLLVERFGDDLKELWMSHGGDGKYPPPSMQSILTLLLIDTADPSDKHCLMLYFLFDLNKSFNLNTSLALGYKEMNSTPECVKQVSTSQFLWNLDHDKLQDALRCVEAEKLDATWVDTTYSVLHLKYSCKDLYDVYRCIGLNTCNHEKKKFIINLFVENGLIIPGFQWTRKNSIGGFEPRCFAFFLQRVHAADGLARLVAKELNLKPRESKMLLQFLKLHKLQSLTKKLEEKIGPNNFIPYPEVADKIFEENCCVNAPTKFERERKSPIKSDEVQKLLKNSFALVKQADNASLQRHLLKRLAKPSILKASDSPSGSPLHVSIATPSPKRLRFQLPLNANVSSSSDDGSPVSEDLLHYEFGTPRASTPKSMSYEEVEPSEPASEPNFEFAAPSAPSVIPESPVISSMSPVDDLNQASINSDIDFTEPKTSTPNDNNSEDSDCEVVQEEKVEIETNEEEMLTDDDESNVQFKSFADNRGDERHEVAAEATPSIVLSSGMEISEDESGEPELQDAGTNDSFASVAVSNESFASAVNESFFSSHMHHSLNASNASFSSALDATLIKDDDDDDDDDATCPITKKRRAEINKDNSMEMFEVDDLCSEQISPSKFWAPPALSKVSMQSEPSTSDVDLSHLPKPPLRPSPRKPVRSALSSPNVEEETSKEDERVHFSFVTNTETISVRQSCQVAVRASPNKANAVAVESTVLVAHRETSTVKISPQKADFIQDESKQAEVAGDSKASGYFHYSKSDFSLISPIKSMEDDKITPTSLHDNNFDPVKESDPVQLVADQASTSSHSEGIAKDLDQREKRFDSVFFRTIDSTLERDMLELSAEARAHRNVLENESEDDVSDDDLTLEKTIILSSGSSGESPQKAHRRSLLPSRSPVKALKKDNVSLACVKSDDSEPEENTHKTADLPQVSPFKRLTRSDMAKQNVPDVQLATKMSTHETASSTTSGAEPREETVDSDVEESSAANEQELTKFELNVFKKTTVVATQSLEPLKTRSEPLKTDESAATPAEIQKSLPDEKPTVDAENALDSGSASEVETKSSDECDEEPEASQEVKPVKPKVKAKTATKKQMLSQEKSSIATAPSKSAKDQSKSSAIKIEQQKVKAEPKEKPSVRNKALSGESTEEAPPRTTRQRKAMGPAQKKQDDKPSPTKSASSTRSIASATQMPIRETRSRKDNKTHGLALTTENLKKFDKQMISSNTEATFSQESSSTAGRGRSRKNSVAPSRESSTSPVRSTRELRSRSQSVVSEILPVPRSRKRSISVASDKTVSSQRSTRSKKRKTDSDSDESTESGVELRRSKRAKVVQGSKRAGRKVSIIPEEND